MCSIALLVENDPSTVDLLMSKLDQVAINWNIFFRNSLSQCAFHLIYEIEGNHLKVTCSYCHRSHNLIASKYKDVSADCEVVRYSRHAVNLPDP